MISDLLDPHSHFLRGEDGLCTYYWRETGLCICSEDVEHYGRQCPTEGKEPAPMEVKAWPI